MSTFSLACHIGISKTKFRFPAVFLRKQNAGDKIGTNSDVTPVFALRSKATGPKGKIVHSLSECLSCSVCFFGSANDPANIAMRVGIITLLVILLGVLGLFAKFFLTIKKRSKLIS